ncbi:MAG: GNAT family N-acetyltransferase [Chlamydiota bacterium]
MKPIETKRLNIRPFLETDLEDLYHLLSNPEVMKYYPSPLDKKGAEEWLERNRKRQKEFGYSLWAIIRKQDRLFVGQCGLVVQDVEDTAMVEIGYMIRNDLWRRGYASEAIDAVLAFASNELHLPEVIALIDPENDPSIRSAFRAGLTKKRVVRKWDKDLLLFSKTL